MPRFKSILVATDFPPDTDNATRKAALLAEQHAARLTMLHVVDPAGSQALRRRFSPTIDIELKTMQTRATLRRFAKDIIGRHGVAAKFEVVTGVAFEEVHSRSERADLVVVGQRGSMVSLKDLVVGSTTERLLRLSRKPVLVVKRGMWLRIARCLYRSTSRTNPRRHWRRLPVSRDAALHVFHAQDSRDEFEMQMADVPSTAIREFREMRQGESCVRIHEMIAKAGLNGRPVFESVAQGDAARMTLEQEKLLCADLIVAGKYGRSAMADFLLGIVSRQVLVGSACDILIIPPIAVESHRTSAAVTHSRPAFQAAPVASSELRSADATGPASARAHHRRDGAQRRFAW